MMYFGHAYKPAIVMDTDFGATPCAHCRQLFAKPVPNARYCHRQGCKLVMRRAAAARRRKRG